MLGRLLLLTLVSHVLRGLVRMLMKRKSGDEQNESVHEFIKTSKATSKSKDGANENGDWDNLSYPIILTIAKSGLANNFLGF